MVIGIGVDGMTQMRHGPIVVEINSALITIVAA
jgi:hypothetical protein